MAVSSDEAPSRAWFGGLYPENSGCLVMHSSGGYGAGSCDEEVEWAGSCSFPSGEVWLAFACERHRDALDNSRRLTAADLAERELRQVNRERALAGVPYRPVRPYRAASKRPHR